MTDIIVRLEQRYEQTAEPECDLIQEAALVIDRLHDELADVRADAALLRADNEQLTAELETQKAISNQIQGHLEHEELRSYKAEADNERLRAAILVEIAKGTYALAQEIGLLRAALVELLSGHDNLYVAHFGPNSNPHDDIAAKPARRALEPKP